MTKYSDEFRSRALEMLVAKGYESTCQTLHVNKHTLYRWKREAGIMLDRHRSSANMPCTDESEEMSLSTGSEPFAVPSELIEDSESSDDSSTFDRDMGNVDDDLRILAAANEKLRKRNAQLRSAILSLLDN